MRKILALGLLFVMLIFMLNDSAYAENAFDKLIRGILNVLVSPLEFFQGMADAYSEHDMAIALPIGLFWGSVNTAKRAGVGIFEIVTFPLPIPADYAPIIEEPVFLVRAKEKAKETLKIEESQTEEPMSPAIESPISIPGM